MSKAPTYETRWWFYTKQVGSWLGAGCYYAYGILSSHWPGGRQEWVLFWLQLIPFVAGAGVAARGVNRLPK